jgi:hypothetical protein
LQIVLTQLLFRRQTLVFYLAGQQAADLYSATIFNVVLIHGGTNFNFGISIKLQ